MSFLTPKEASNPNYEDRLKDKNPMDVDFLRLFKVDKDNTPKEFQTLWGTYSSALSRIGMPSFKVARKTFSTTARRLRIDEGYTRTMLGQKDNSISISYVDYDDPQLFGELCLAHIKVLNGFDMIGLYNTWLRKIDEVFGSDWSKNETYIKGNPNFIYSSYAHAIQPIIASNKTFLK